MMLKSTLTVAVISIPVIGVWPANAQSVYGPQYSYGPPSNFDTTHIPPKDWADQRKQRQAKYCAVDPEAGHRQAMRLLLMKRRGFAMLRSPSH
jgi:hypothetical protein